MVVSILVRYESIAKTAMSWLTAEHIDNLHPSPVAGLIWDAALSTLQAAGSLPKTASFFTQVYEAIVTERYDEAKAQELIGIGRSVIASIFEEPEDQTKQTAVRGMLKELHKEFVVIPEMTRAFAAATASGDYAELSKTQAKLSTALAAISEEGVYADPLNTIDDIDKPVSTEDHKGDDLGSRLITGTVLDALHRGRGVYRGFMSLVLGPTSGGKTTLAHNLIAESCMLGHSVGLVSTEEDLETSAMAKSRLLAAATGVSTDDWDAANNDVRRLTKPLTPAQIDRLKRMRASTKFYNFKSTPTFKDLTDRVEAAAEEIGKLHDLLVIDWAGPLAKVISQASGEPDHVTLESISFGCQEFSKKTGIAIFLLHQLSAEAVKRNGIFGKKYSEYDSSNCKKMAQYSAATYIITPCDKELRLRLIGAKLRADVKNFEVVAQLDPKFSRMTYLESMTTQGASFRDARAPVSNETGHKILSVRKS